MKYQFLNYFLSAYSLVLGAMIGWFIWMLKEEKKWNKISSQHGENGG